MCSSFFLLLREKEVEVYRGSEAQLQGRSIDKFYMCRVRVEREPIKRFICFRKANKYFLCARARKPAIYLRAVVAVAANRASVTYSFGKLQRARKIFGKETVCLEKVRLLEMAERDASMRTGFII